ncbi:ROK family protein [Mesorhizobium sp. BH1-1-4]|uniref:ROK family protein n=1 Tax=Mesorhizobium sp. BH1-1-4 TaxID=2876662 RepID=UPI001CD156DC|nr:ROK family protein [Mesorhizobium sp. BH1-1-4]MBZ9994310.1 ROK family protein [Mesorhizobium sp. BH1-1-4]
MGAAKEGWIYSMGVAAEEQKRGRQFRPIHNLISTASVGAVNRGRLLQALYDMGPSSRADLARFTGVSRGTIGGIVQPLLDQRILVEGEVVQPNQAGGKPPTKLWFSKDAKPICAVLLMHDHVRTCLVSLDGEIYAQNSAAFSKELTDPREAFTIISGCVERAITSVDLPILGIGVAIAGMINTDAGSIVAINLASFFNGFPIGAELEKRFDVPVCVDQDARALLVGDRWFGKGRGRRNFAVVYTGEVLGVALYLDGHLYRGAAGAGGEIGHTTVQLNGRACKCGRRGCWETIATLAWLRDEARERGLPQPASMDSRRLIVLADQRVAEAADLLQQYAFNISVGLANLQQLMAPNYIILHGDVAQGGERMIDLIDESFRKLILDRPDDEVVLALGDSEDVAALRGAAGLVLSELLNFPL